MVSRAAVLDGSHLKVVGGQIAVGNVLAECQHHLVFDIQHAVGRLRAAELYRTLRVLDAAQHFRLVSHHRARGILAVADRADVIALVLVAEEIGRHRDVLVDPFLGLGVGDILLVLVERAQHAPLLRLGDGLVLHLYPVESSPVDVIVGDGEWQVVFAIDSIALGVQRPVVTRRLEVHLGARRDEVCRERDGVGNHFLEACRVALALRAEHELHTLIIVGVCADAHLECLGQHFAVRHEEHASVAQWHAVDAKFRTVRYRAVDNPQDKPSLSMSLRFVVHRQSKRCRIV